MTPVIPKVSAFITRGNQLLVFGKPNHPGTGTQVPAGTMDAGETPEQAVLREVWEETGLNEWSLHCALEHRLVDMQQFGSAEVHDRWFFHLVAPMDSPDSWRHGESDPSSGTEQHIPFDFFWLDVADAADALREENQPALMALRHCLTGHIEGNLRS